MATGKKTAEAPAASTILEELKRLGTPRTRQTLAKHGYPASGYGVLVADLKAILKRLGEDKALSLELWETGQPDAMYLAGLLAEPSLMTKEELDRWARSSTWHQLSEYSVAGAAAESPHGWELGLAWIGDPAEPVAAAGWATLAGVLGYAKAPYPDLGEVRKLLGRVVRDLAGGGNRVRYTMNGFVIAAGASHPGLLADARAAAAKLGRVEVDMGGTACAVPDAAEYLARIEERGGIGKRRNHVRC